MALKHPVDLASWQQWQDSQHRVKNLAKKVLRGGSGSGDQAPMLAYLARQSDQPTQIAAILESRAASGRMAVLAPLAHLGDLSLAVVAPFDPSEYLGAGWQVERVEFDPATQLPEVAVVLSAAHYLPLGALAFADARRRQLQYVTVQHGLLTPLAPPLPVDAPLLAWSQSDADFWISGRGDVDAVVVGSQLLWQVQQAPVRHVSRFVRPVYLGQLHGAELPRAGMTRAIIDFCREVNAVYRPHPSEIDRVSQLQHRSFAALGIEIDRSGVPLANLDAPVVSAFSTGVLEAAAKGVPAWVSYPQPPAWLAECWDRYNLHEWGDSPTPAPTPASVEPALAVANYLRAQL